jgi:hypothetical protein
MHGLIELALEDRSLELNEYRGFKHLRLTYYAR